MKTVCAWCQKHMAGEGDDVSHGICLECLELYFPKMAGVWAVCMPVGSEEYVPFRHYFEEETALWGCANATSVCKIIYPVGSMAVLIGSVSSKWSREPCPDCLASLKARGAKR